MFKNEKKELVKGLTKLVDDRSIVFVDYEGMDMDGFDGIRSDVHADGSVVKVVKNTLLRRVLEMTKSAELLGSVPQEVFSGMTAIALMDESNFSSSGKSVLGAEKEEKIKIKGGIHEGKFISAGEVRVLASIPSKEELYSILAGALSSIVGKLVVVLDEVKENKENK